MAKVMLFSFNLVDNQRVEELGIAYIASTLRMQGHDVTIDSIHAKTYPYEEIVAFQPDYIGCTTYYDTREDVSYFIHKVKSITNCKICLGGIHASLFAVEWMQKNPDIDHIIKGEGEYTYCELINALDNNTSLEGINGLVYRKDGQVIENPDRPLIAPLSELPRASRDVIKKYHLRRALISTSRGCKRSCRFCCSPLYWRRGGKRQWRGLDMKDVAEEIQLIYNTYGISCFFIQDESFEDDIEDSYQRLFEIANLLIQQQNPYCLTVYTRCDFYQKSSPELMQLLKQAGLVRVFIGIESANCEDLKLYGKSDNFYHSEKSIQYFNVNEINTSIGFINFNPFSTMERLYENLNFLKRNKLLCNRFPMHSRLSIYKGTALYEQFMREGYLKGDLTDDLSPIFNDSIRGLADYLSYFISSKSADNYKLQFFLNDHIINIRLILKYANEMRDDGSIQRIRHYQQMLDEIRMKCEERVYEWYSCLLELTAKGFEAGVAENITSQFLNDEFFRYQTVIEREQRQMLKELIRKDKQYYTVFNRYVM